MVKRILLVCAGGFSTSMLVERMKEAAKNQGITLDIEATAEDRIGHAIDNTDIIMLGPQMSHAEEEIVEKYGDKIPVTVINMLDYGMMDGEKVLATALSIINK